MIVSPPKDIAAMARFILSSECKSILVLTGAGTSVASGIPDFRSPGGMYDTLRPNLITASPAERRLMEVDPTYVVEKEMFLGNAFPYLEVRRPFILGTREEKWKATIAHRFFELLHVKTNKLTRLYTQNIDGLEYQCKQIPKDKIVNVHGTISKVACESCGEEVDFGDFCDNVKTSIKDIYDIDEDAPETSTPIHCKACGNATVKPKTVLFGSSLPTEFFTCSEQDLENADLIIVAGTSLVVSPVNSLVYRVKDECLRMVVNKDPVGAELGINYSASGPSCGRDFFAQGSCDKVFLDLIDMLGWGDDLRSIPHLLPESSVDLL